MTAPSPDQMIAHRLDRALRDPRCRRCGEPGGRWEGVWPVPCVVCCAAAANRQEEAA